MDLICCALECLGCYYLCRICTGRSPNPCASSKGQAQAQQPMYNQQQQQGGGGGYIMQAPGRQNQDWNNQSARAPARYERGAYVLGSAQPQAQPQPPASYLAHASARPASTTKGGSTFATMNGSQQQNGIPVGSVGYRLGDSQPFVQTHASQSQGQGQTHGLVSDQPPSYTQSVAVVVDPNLLTLSEQVDVMPKNSIKLLKTILKNAIESPESTSDATSSKENLTKRKIKYSNDKVQQQIVNVAGALQILYNAEFQLTEFVDDKEKTDQYLYFAPGTNKQSCIDALDHLNNVRADVAAVKATLPQ